MRYQLKNMHFVPCYLSLLFYFRSGEVVRHPFPRSTSGMDGKANKDSTELCRRRKEEQLGQDRARDKEAAENGDALGEEEEILVMADLPEYAGVALFEETESIEIKVGGEDGVG